MFDNTPGADLFIPDLATMAIHAGHNKASCEALRHYYTVSLIIWRIETEGSGVTKNGMSVSILSEESANS